jgi:hypothetical protein
VQKSQSKKKRSTTDRNYAARDTVRVLDYREKHETWILGVITSQTGPVSYKVKIIPGITWKRLTEQLLNYSYLL